MLGKLARDTIGKIADTADSIADTAIDAVSDIVKKTGDLATDVAGPTAGKIVNKVDDIQRKAYSEIRDKTRRIGASIRPIEKKKAPKTLTIVGFVGLVFASFYLIKLFGGLQSLLGYEGSTADIVLSAIVVCIVFFQYMTYVTTVFRLSSGMRQAWANMIRLSGTYVLLMIIANSHVLDFLSVNLVVTNSWVLAGVMLFIMVYMLLPMVRSFFKPSYEDDVPLKEWVKLVFWMDPYKDADGIELDAQTS